MGEEACLAFENPYEYLYNNDGQFLPSCICFLPESILTTLVSRTGIHMENALYYKGEVGSSLGLLHLFNKLTRLT